VSILDGILIGTLVHAQRLVGISLFAVYSEQSMQCQQQQGGSNGGQQTHLPATSACTYN
jgi:hypothetical protein